MLDTLVPSIDNIDVTPGLGGINCMNIGVECFSDMYTIYEITSVPCDDTVFVEITIKQPPFEGDMECSGTIYEVDVFAFQKTSCALQPAPKTIECNENFITLSNDPPTIADPQDLTVECLSAAQDSINNQLVRFNNGLGVTISCDYGFTVTSSLIGTNSCNGQTFDIEYYLTENECGLRKDTAVQTFTISNSFPSLVCPTKDTVECHSDITDFAILEGASIVTSLSGILCDYTYNLLEAKVPDSTSNCPSTLYTVEYVIEEAPCNRKDSCTQIIEILNEKPGITTCPMDMMVTCISEIEADTMALIFTTSCMIPASRTANAMVGDPMNSACGEMSGDKYTILYTVTDGCGRDSTCTQTLTIDNNNKTPIIDQTSCPAATSVTMPIEVNAVDDRMGILHNELCDTIITKGDAVFISGSALCGGAIYEVKYFVSNNCESDSCTQTITLSMGTDTSDPMISCPPDTIIDCNATIPTQITSISALMNAGGDVTDNCPLSSTLGLDVKDVNLKVNSCSYLLSRTYVLTMSPDRIDSCTQTITTQDTIAPILPMSLPDSTGLDCGEPLPVVDDFADLVDMFGNEFFCATGSGIFSGLVLGCPMTGSGIMAGHGIDNCTPNGDLIVTYSDDSTQLASFCAKDILALGRAPTITRTYTIADSCDNKSTVQQKFTFKADNKGPVITCPPVTLSTDPGVCYTKTFPALPTAVEDLCGSGVDSIYLTKPQDSLVLGPNVVEWSALDGCGNPGHCTQIVTVEDRESPTIACENDTLDLCLYNGTMTVDPKVMFRGVSDNCSGEYDISICIFRMGGPCGANLDFDCSDVDSVIMIGLIATDDAGNSTDPMRNANTCMRAVKISDCTAPIVDCPDPIEVDCDDLTAPSNPVRFGELNVFGKVAQSPTNQLASDGLATDVCGIDTVIELSFVDTSFCRNPISNLVRTITRNFEATDIHGNRATCSQLISIIDTSPFGEIDIEWPVDTSAICGASIDTSLLGSPILSNTKGTSIFSSLQDDIDYIYKVEGVCTRIWREWTIVDWCQFDETTNTGIWRDTQYIDIIAASQPVLVADTTHRSICTTDCTDANYSFSFSAIPSCDVTLPMFYWYDIVQESGLTRRGNGNTINTELPLGTHEIFIYAKDGCHLVVSDSFSVTIRDCKPPGIVCIQGLVMNLMDTSPPMVPIWANDFNNGTKDNCTDTDELLFSFSPNVLDTGRVYTCNDISARQAVTIYVTDEHGNQSSCETYAVIQNNGVECPVQLPHGDDDQGAEDTEEETTGDSTATEDNEDEIITNTNQLAMVSGKIANHKGDGIMNTEVNILGAAMDEYQMTSDQGGYAFESLDMYKDYMVRPSKNDDALNGVSTLDLVLIQKHILGINLISDPYLRIAADVNGSDNISARDLVELRKLILGSIDNFTNSESWRFVDASYELDLNNPWNFPEEIEYFNLDNNQMTTDFVGIKIGDINGNSTTNINDPNVEIRSAEKMKLGIANRKFVKGDNLIVGLKAKKDIDLNGMQLALKIDKDLELVDVISDRLEIRNDHYRIDRNELVISWTQEEVANIIDGDNLFELAFRANGSGNVVEAIHIIGDRLSAEVYDENLEIQEVILDVDGNNMVQFQLYQNRPNPFIAATEIEFYLPKAMEATIVAYDVKGQMLLKKSDYYKSGMNRLMITKDELGISSGVIYYRLEAGEYKDVKTMILIE